MLISKSTVQYLLYLTVHRSGGGLWYLQLRTLSPDQYLDDIEYKIDVYNTSRSVTSSMFSYSGKAVSHKLSVPDVVDTGNFLALTDWQMKSLNTPDMIFEYKIVVNIAQHNHEKPKLLPPPITPNKPPEDATKNNVTVDTAARILRRGL